MNYIWERLSEERDFHSKVILLGRYAKECLICFGEINFCFPLLAIFGSLYSVFIEASSGIECLLVFKIPLFFLM